MGDTIDLSTYFPDETCSKLSCVKHRTSQAVFLGRATASDKTVTCPYSTAFVTIRLCLVGPILQRRRPENEMSHPWAACMMLQGPR